MKHRGWIAFSGLIWLAAGISLVHKGLKFVADARYFPDAFCVRFQERFGSVQAAGTALIAVALLIGFIKGRFVLVKTVRRVSFRIQSLPLPIKITSLYTPSYLILLGSMMGLGFLIRFIPMPTDIRGFIDVAIGSALINGAILYFRAARGSLRVN